MKPPSRKLDTSHLAKQLEDIMDSEGISIEHLIQKSGVSQSTIYAILNRDRSTTLRMVAVKIAKALGKECAIDGDTVFFKDIGSNQDEKTHSAAEFEVLDTIESLLDKYSDEEKQKLTHNLPDILEPVFDMILRTVTPFIQSPIESIPPDETDFSGVDKKFYGIWVSPDVPKQEKISQSKTLLRSTNIPKLLYTSFRRHVTINERGDADFSTIFHATNLGDEPVTGVSNTLFTQGTTESIDVMAISNGQKLQTHTIHDYGNYKQFFTMFSEPLESEESIILELKYAPKGMYLPGRYGLYWTITNLVLNVSIDVTHQIGKKLKSGWIEKHTGKETSTKLNNENLEFTQEDGQLQVRWKKYFPSLGAKYWIRWKFEEKSFQQESTKNK